MSTALTKLKDEGGFTLNIVTGEWITKGFAVSVNPELTRVIDGPVDVITLAQYAGDNAEILTSGEKVFGAWLDIETGRTYLDVVTICATRTRAMELAIAHGELAIFDLGSGQEIRTGLVKA